MRSYGIEMEGKIIIQKVTTLPAWGATDEGRLVYAEDVDKFYFGDDVAWVETGGKLDPAAGGADHTASGSIDILTAGENLVFGEVCYFKSDGKMWEADADASTTMPVVGMALATISADATGNFLKRGYVRDDSWSFTVGGLIYASVTSGTISQTAPVGAGDQVQIIGFAYSATIAFFNPQYAMLEI